MPSIYFEVLSVSSVTQSCPTLRPHESQQARPPCSSPTPGIHSDSSPSSQWCHPAISSSVVPFSSCPQSLPASESFPISQLFGLSSPSAPPQGCQSLSTSTFLPPFLLSYVLPVGSFLVLLGVWGPPLVFSRCSVRVVLMYSWYTCEEMLTSYPHIPPCSRSFSLSFYI